MKDSPAVSIKTIGHGTPFFLTAITLVATIGGFLFGFDTAVVNGAEKSLVDFYITKALDPSNYSYAVTLISQYRILVAMVFSLVFVIIAGLIIRLAEIKKGLFINFFLLIGLIFFLVNYLSHPVPPQGASADIQNIADSVKGFVVSSALVGCIIGGALSGFIAKSLGRKSRIDNFCHTLSISAFGAWQPEFFNIFGTLPDIFVHYLQDNWRDRNRSGLYPFTYVYRRDISCGHPGKACIVEPVCNCIRHGDNILCQLPDRQKRQ